MRAASARVALLAIAAVLAPASALVPVASSVHLAIAAAAVVMFAHCVWLGNLTTLVIDAIPGPLMTTTFGLAAAGSAAGGILMNTLVAFAITHYSYTPCFVVMACMHPIALAVLWPFRKTGPSQVAAS